MAAFKANNCQRMEMEARARTAHGHLSKQHSTHMHTKMSHEQDIKLSVQVTYPLVQHVLQGPNEGLQPPPMYTYNNP